MSWASLKHSWTYGPYTANVEYKAIQLLELESVASTPWMCLQKAEFVAILHNEPRCWATAGAYMEAHSAITATLQLAQGFMAAQGTQNTGGEAAFWAGAVQYVLSLRDALTSAASAKWDPLQAGLCTLQHEEALAWAFPRPGASLDGRYVWERVQWLAFLLQSTRERIADGLLLGDTDAALLRQASRVAAGALQLHGDAAPAVRKEALDLQKMIRAAGGDPTVLEAAQGPPAAGADSPEHRGSALPPVLQWACRQEALQPGSMVEVRGQHAPDALLLLVEGPQSAASVSAAWQAASLLAHDSTEAALEAWLQFMHACRQQGTGMRLFVALIQGEQPQACHLGEVTGLLVTAWQAATRMQDWPVGAATKLMSASTILVHSLLQEVGQTGRACLEADDMAVDTDAVPDTPPEDEGVGAVANDIYMRAPVLEAAVIANPRAVADYATVALLSMGASDSDGTSLDALLDAMTPALACGSSASARCSVASQVAASVMHLCDEAEAATQAAQRDDLESRQHLAACIRRLAAAAVLTRQQALVYSLKSALETLQRRSAAHEKAAEDGLLSLGEQGAVLQHILLCPAPELPSAGELQQAIASRGSGAELQPGCSLSQLLLGLQPLCREYCAACSGAADGASCSDRARLLPQWLPHQVQATCGRDGLPMLADSLACLCCSWGACLRAPVLEALSDLLHDDSCGPTAHSLVSTVNGGLLPWLQSGAEPHQVPEEAWAAQSLQASAEHLLNAMDGQNSSLRGSALRMLLDNLGYRPELPAAFSHTLAQRGLALKAASPELFTAARISVKRLCTQADSLPASQAALLHLAACCLAALRHHHHDDEKGALFQRCTISITCLHEMAVAAPHILCRLDSYPALLEQLVSLACPNIAQQQSSAALPAIDAHCVEGSAVQLAAVSSMCALAAHDELARKVYLSRLLPMALAAPSSHESCWQAVLAACPAVLAAVQAPGGLEVGEHAESFSVREIVRSLVKTGSLTRTPKAEGAVMDARRLHRLMQLHVCS